MAGQSYDEQLFVDRLPHCSNQMKEAPPGKWKMEDFC